MANFIEELKRRSVFRVGIAYLLVAWLILQLTDLVFENMNAPDWVMQAIMLIIAVGFPIALVLAWAFEIKADGVRSDAAGSAANSRLFYAIVGVISIAAIGLFLWQRSGLPTAATESPSDSASESVGASGDDNESLLAIAVLPFESFTEDREDQFFADGLADTLLHKLAQLETLTVIARNSSFQYKGQNVDVREIGEKLGVPTVVEGSVQRQGDQIRIIAQLVSTKDGSHLWSSTFDGTFENIFDLQDNVAAAIAEQLQITLSDQDRERLYRKGTDIPEAYEALARARAIDIDVDNAGFDPDDNPKILLLRRVVELDPNYALAWADLSSYYNGLAFLGSNTARFDEFVAESMAAAQKAIEVDPDESDGYVTLGYAHWRLQELAEAEDAFRNALAINPNNGGALSGLGLILMLSSPEEAYLLFKRGQEIDPTNILVYRQLFLTLVRLGRPDEGVVQLEKGISLDPDFFILYADLAELHSESFGRYDLAAMVLSKLLRRDPNSRTAMDGIAEAWYAVNDLPRTSAWNEQLLEKNPGDNDAKSLKIRLLRLQGDMVSAFAMAETMPAQGFAAYTRSMSLLHICISTGDRDCAVERLESLLQLMAGFEARSGLTMRGIHAVLDFYRGQLLYPDERTAGAALELAAETFGGFTLFSSGSPDVDSRRYRLAEILTLQGREGEAAEELMRTLDAADGGFVATASDGLHPEISSILPTLRAQPGFDEWLAAFTSRRTAMHERMLKMEAASEIARTP